jgi:hypothetical protein
MSMEQQIMEALARGYCVEPNTSKVLDSDLIMAMTQEVLKSVGFIPKDDSHLVEKRVINFLPDAVKIVTKEIKADKELYRSYQDNIAMAFKDTYAQHKKTMNKKWYVSNQDVHKIANKAAKYFLDLWCK